MYIMVTSPRSVNRRTIVSALGEPARVELVGFATKYSHKVFLVEGVADVVKKLRAEGIISEKAPEPKK